MVILDLLQFSRLAVGYSLDLIEFVFCISAHLGKSILLRFAIIGKSILIRSAILF